MLRSRDRDGASHIGVQPLLRLEECQEIICVFFLHGKNVFDEPSGCHILVTEPTDDLGVGVDCDALRNEILLDHVHEIVARDVFGMAPARETFRVEVRLTL